MSYIADDYLAEKFKKETDKEADYEENDKYAIGRVNHYYRDSYVEWLEEKLLKCVDNAGRWEDMNIRD